MPPLRVAPHDAIHALTESDRRRASIVTAYAFPEDDIPTHALADWIGERSERVPELRQNFVRPFGDIGDAYWSDAPDFSRDDHIVDLQERTWPEVCTLLAELHDRPFDYQKPLWNAYIVRNVTDIDARSRPIIVVILRFHHCMTDGMGAARIARSLFSRQVLAPTESRTVSRARATFLETLRLPLRPFLVCTDLIRTARSAVRINRSRSAGEWAPVDAAPRTTILNGPVGNRRAVEIVFCSVKSLRAAAHSIGTVSVNDLVLSAIGAATAKHFNDDGPLLASVPVSVRSATDRHARNAVALATVPLHTEAPFSEQVQAIHRAVRSERNRFNLPEFSELAANPLPRFPGFVYVALGRWQDARTQRRVRPPLTQVKVSSVPKGPATDWQLCSLPVLSNFGVSPVADGLRVNHTVSSIGDTLTIGILADDDNVPDFDAYANLLRAEMSAIINDADQS